MPTEITNTNQVVIQELVNSSVVIAEDGFVIQISNQDVTVVSVSGPQGPAGPAGASGDKNYTHDQTNASATWIINHNLAKYPSVSVVDTGGNWVIGDISYTNLNQVIISFAAAFSGKAYFN